MSAIADLHIISYDIVFAKDGHVLLRYSAEGSHCGQPHNGIEASGNKAKWSAAAIFEVKDGKVRSFTKEWDKLNMWKQLGWVCSLFTASSGPRSELQGIFGIILWERNCFERPFVMSLCLESRLLGSIIWERNCFKPPFILFL